MKRALDFAAFPGFFAACLCHWRLTFHWCRIDLFPADRRLFRLGKWRVYLLQR